MGRFLAIVVFLVAVALLVNKAISDKGSDKPVAKTPADKSTPETPTGEPASAGGDSAKKSSKGFK